MKQFEYRQVKNMRYEKHVCIKALSYHDKSLKSKDVCVRFVVDPWWACTQIGLWTVSSKKDEGPFLAFNSQEHLFLPLEPWGVDLKFIASTIRVEVVDKKYKKRAWDEPKEFVIAEGQIDLVELCKKSKELKTGEVCANTYWLIPV